VKTFDVVRLIDDVPEAGLRTGAEGTIIEIYTSPELAYEVEFAGGITAAVKPELLALVDLP
jgi:hypothetical protein